MELLFTPEQLGNVRKKLKIDLERYIQELLFLERVYEGDSLLLSRKEIDNVERIVTEELKYESYTYQSLLYYLGKTKRFLERRDYSLLSKEEYFSLMGFLLCSLYNHICYLVEKANYTEDKPSVVVFEACPEDLDIIKTREEVLKIKQRADRRNLNTVIRFHTSVGIFKKTLNEYRADYLHFVGHGGEKGDLVFLGSNGGNRFLGFPVFENYFANGYLKHHLQPNIRNFFINSCFSDLFAMKINKSRLINGLFSNSISHHEDNYDDLAVEFADHFYEREFDIHSVVDSFEYVSRSFLRSSDPDRVDYAKNAVLL